MLCSNCRAKINGLLGSVVHKNMAAKPMVRQAKICDVSKNLGLSS